MAVIHPLYQLTQEQLHLEEKHLQKIKSYYNSRICYAMVFFFFLLVHCRHTICLINIHIYFYKK